MLPFALGWMYGAPKPFSASLVSRGSPGALQKRDHKMLKQVMQAYEFLDDAHINGPKVAELLKSRGLERIDVKTISGTEGSTDFIRIVIPGVEGKQSEGSAPTLGIIGRLGGIGARPERIGMVSDADGAITAISCALKLADIEEQRGYTEG